MVLNSLLQLGSNASFCERWHRAALTIEGLDLGRLMSPGAVLRKEFWLVRTLGRKGRVCLLCFSSGSSRATEDIETRL